MDAANKKQDIDQENVTQQTTTNPFENKEPVEKDIQQSEGELDKEQQFKEASTERD